MNYENLHELIHRYEAEIDRLYNEKHDELFKWRAAQTWQREWTRPAGSFASFEERFNAARRDFSVLIDGNIMHPSNGVIKLWEKDPVEIERLFNEVLFADVGRDISAAQDQMDAFLEGYEALRQKHFPANWSYKQDRHSASVFLAVNNPSLHYIYRSSNASAMAKYVDFGFSIGSGGSFSLVNYYRLCEELVAALKQHPSLLEKHFSRITEDLYYDKSLHLLAFDLMYCCRTYNFYQGLTAPVTGKAIRKTGSAAPSQEEMEAEQAKRRAELEDEIAALERTCEACCELSLVGVQVTAPKYGIGTVVSQSASTISVQFTEEKKSYILDKKYTSRPVFENAETVVAVFTEYNAAAERLKSLRRQLASI